jgi:predicted acetyltransferase
MTFAFLEWGTVTEGVVDLSHVPHDPADPARGYVPSYHFEIARPAVPGAVGKLPLRLRSVTATPSLRTSGHVGYEVDEAPRGPRFVLRTGRLMEPIPPAHDLPTLIVTCDPDNEASRRTIERLGARLLGRFPVPPDRLMYRDGRREIPRYKWFPTGRS